MNALRNMCFHRVMQLVPGLSAALVIALPLWLHHAPDEAPASAPADAEAIIAAVNAAPYRIGRWVGADVPLPEAAGQQLRPTAALSRRYVHLDYGHTVELSVIHSGDARDMVGHHPAVCFPSNGWIAGAADRRHSNAKATETRITIAESSIQMRRYEFTRPSVWTEPFHIRVFNCYALPDGMLTHDLQDVQRRTRWLGPASQGVAQVQVLTHINMNEQDALNAAAELLSGLKSVFEAMGVNFHG